MDESKICYVVLVDGLPLVWADSDELPDSWAIAEGFERVHAGLVRPPKLSMGTDLRSGDWTDQSFTIEIEDVDGTLPGILGGSLSSAEDLVSTIEAGGTAPAFAWNKHVGDEEIGPAGERHRYSCWPGFAVGKRHIGAGTAWALGVDAAPITDGAKILSGRRFTAWRVAWVDGEWETLDQAQLAGIGTVLGRGPIEDGRWSLKCQGIEGWIGGNLAAANLTDPIPCMPITVIGDGFFESSLYASLDLVQLSDLENVKHSWVEASTPTAGTLTVGQNTYADLVASFNTLIAAVVSDATSGWSYEFGGSNSQIIYRDTPGADGLSITWHRDVEVASGFIAAVEIPGWVARLQVSGPEAFWAGLGFDVRAQPNVDPVENAEAYVMFSPSPVFADHFVGSFYSASPQAMKAKIEGDYAPLFIYDDDSDAYTNFQTARRWAPLFQGGAVTWTLTPGQEVQLASFDPVHLFATRSRPPMADPADVTGETPYSLAGGVGEVNSQGLVVVEGPFRYVDDLGQPGDSIPDDASTERRKGRTSQVMRLSWRANDDGSMAVDSDGFARAVVYQVEDPREYGFEFPRINGSWSGWRSPPPGVEPMGLRPLIALEFASGEGQRIDLLMLRALASTGTAGVWASDDTYATPIFGLAHPTPTLEPGANDLDADITIDAEVAELGVAIPADLIAPASRWKSVALAVGTELSRAKVVHTATASRREMFAKMLSPTGLAWSFAGGRLGILDPTRWPDPSEVTVNISPSDYAGKVGDPLSVKAKQDIRDWAPIDVVTIEGTRSPVTGAMLTKYTRRSTGRGASHRSQTIPHRVAGWYLVNRLSGVPGSNWVPDVNARITAFCDFWEKNHFVVTVILDAADFANVWPGDAFMLTDPALVDPSGSVTYGVTQAIGVFTDRSYNADAETITFIGIVNAETAIVMYAAAALVTEYVAGPDYELACDDDWLSVRSDGSLDVDGFAEPAWSSVGGTIGIEVFEFDGSTWTRGLVGEVVSIESVPGSSKMILAGPITGGTWFRDRYHLAVPRKYADQAAAWIFAWLAPIADENGLAEGDPAKPFRD